MHDEIITSAFGDPAEEREVRLAVLLSLSVCNRLHVFVIVFAVLASQWGAMVRDYARKHRAAVEKELSKGGKLDAKAVLDCYRNPRVSVE